jgi:hypothetical protein
LLPPQVVLVHGMSVLQSKLRRPASQVHTVLVALQVEAAGQVCVVSGQVTLLDSLRHSVLVQRTALITCAQCTPGGMHSLRLSNERFWQVVPIGHVTPGSVQSRRHTPPPKFSVQLRPDGHAGLHGISHAPVPVVTLHTAPGAATAQLVGSSPVVHVASSLATSHRLFAHASPPGHV